MATPCAQTGHAGQLLCDYVCQRHVRRALGLTDPELLRCWCCFSFHVLVYDQQDLPGSRRIASMPGQHSAAQLSNSAAWRVCGPTLQWEARSETGELPHKAQQALDCRLLDHHAMLTLKRSRALSEMVLLSLRESRSTFFVRMACQTCTDTRYVSELICSGCFVKRCSCQLKAMQTVLLHGKPVRYHTGEHNTGGRACELACCRERFCTESQKGKVPVSSWYSSMPMLQRSAGGPYSCMITSGAM